MKTFKEYLSEKDSFTDRAAAWLTRKITKTTLPLTPDERARERAVKQAERDADANKLKKSLAARGIKESAEEQDLTIHSDEWNKPDRGYHSETFAGKLSANKFHHKVNTTKGHKVIHREVKHVAGLGPVTTIHYIGGHVAK